MTLICGVIFIDYVYVESYRKKLYIRLLIEKLPINNGKSLCFVDGECISDSNRNLDPAAGGCTLKELALWSKCRTSVRTPYTCDCRYTSLAWPYLEKLAPHSKLSLSA